jgi:hypothetical protein
MAKVYCSQKLVVLLGISTKSKNVEPTAADLYSWNAMLFYLNKRKCL